MNQYKKILIAIDGSGAAKKGFEKGLSIAKANDAKLILTHVIDTRTFATAEAYDRSIVERANKYAHELIEEYEQAAKEAGITNVEKCIEYGSPKVKIPKDIAKEQQVDLIICGATGLNAVERFLIGSVSESITRYASCDVLVVRE